MSKMHVGGAHLEQRGPKVEKSGALAAWVRDYECEYGV